MAGQYFPSKDNDFANWLATFLTNATANTTALGLVSGDLTPISTLQTTYNTDLLDVDAKKAALASSVQVKDATKESIIAKVRVVVNKIQHCGVISCIECRPAKLYLDCSFEFIFYLIAIQQQRDLLIGRSPCITHPVRTMPMIRNYNKKCISKPFLLLCFCNKITNTFISINYRIKKFYFNSIAS